MASEMSTNTEALQMIPSDVVRNALIELIEGNIPTKNYKLIIEPGSVKGDNYIGVVFRISALYYQSTERRSSKEQKFGLFLKVPPENLIRREQFAVKPCFVRESLIYEEYLPLIADFQLSKDIIPEESGFHEYVKCYKNISQELHEAIFMDDISLKGYTMFNRLQAPTLDIVMVIMRTLGKLHALSFALKDQAPEKFAKYTKLNDIFLGLTKNDFFTTYVNDMRRVLEDSISGEGDEKYLNKLRSFLEKKNLFDHLTHLVNGKEAEPYAVLCHGDCWNNNMLFKFENGEAVDMKLVDWQVARYASPACDLMYYIFSCTTKPFRDEYYEKILDTYYTELAQFLRKLGSDPETLFPRSAFEDQVAKFGAFGLIMGVMIIPTVNTKSEDVPDLNELSEKIGAQDIEYTNEKFYKEISANASRIRDIIIDHVNHNYI